MMDRRSILPLGIAAVAAMAAGESIHAQGSGGVKITVLYGQPKNVEEFDQYYFGTHMPRIREAKGIRQIELAKGMPRPDGSAPPFYRITELWFDSAEQMTSVTSTPHWQMVRDDVSKFASGGVTVLISKIE